MKPSPHRPWLPALLRWVLVIPLGLYALYVGSLVFLQDMLIFPAPDLPASTLTAWADEAGATELTIPTPDGGHIYGWHLKGTERRAVLFFHGNGDTVRGSAALKSILGPTWHVIGVSYHGYPGGTGTASEAALEMDAKAAWTYVTQDLGFSGLQVVVHGRSLGGSAAAYLAADTPPAALVMGSTFLSMEEVAQDNHPLAPVSLLLRHPLRTRDRAPHIDVRTLVMHSTDDDLIPVRHGQQLGQLFPRGEYLERPGYGHNGWLAVRDDEARARYLRFVSAAAPIRDPY
ncbi:MAG: alpha/beta hydrolase [Myxococcota bacterium]